MASPKVDFPPVIALPANHAGIETTIHTMTRPMMVTGSSKSSAKAGKNLCLLKTSTTW